METRRRGGRAWQVVAFCKTHRIGRKLLVCLVVALFLFGGQLACWSDETNRMFKAWKLADGLAIMLDVLFLGLLLTLAAVFMSRLKSRRLQSLARFVFLLLLAVGVVGTISACFDYGDGTVTHADQRSCGWPLTLAWIAAVVFLFLARDRLMRPAVNLCLVLSPIVPIMFFQLCTWSTFGKRPNAAEPSVVFQTAPENRTHPERFKDAADTSANPGGRDSGGTSPVFVFLFDEWSFLRSAEGHDFHPFLPNIRGFAEQSIVFTRARAPGSATFLSIPRLLYQRDGELRPVEGRLCWDSGDACVPADSVPTLFDTASEHGYRTAFLGSYLECFSSVIGDRVDCYLGPGAVRPPQPGLAGRIAPARTLVVGMAAAAGRNGRFCNDPLSRWLEYEVRSSKVSWASYTRTRRFRENVFKVIDHSPNHTFAFFHWPFPHGPFVFNPDGSFYGPVPAGEAGHTPEGYHRQLCYLDRLVGEIIDRLRAAGKLDRAMIVLTSDHSWRSDPDPAMQQQSMENHRVPLIVKLPGQTEGIWLDEPFESIRIQPLIEMVMRGETDRNQALALIRHLSPGVELPDVRTAELKLQTCETLR